MLTDFNAATADLVHAVQNAFPDVMVIALFVTAAIILLHFVLALIGRKTAPAKRRWNLWERLVYLGALVSVAGLAFTSFYPILTLGTMRHWWLFAHMFGAGVLVAVLPLIAINWAGPSCFGHPDSSEQPRAEAPRFFRTTKVMFWLFLTSGFVVVLTTLLSMVPIFGTDGMHILLDIHRYSGLIAVVALAFHFYYVLLQRARIR
ncbi:MAG: hypothetical protein ACQESR_22505 [Planctomycetota bacterium]